MWIVFGNKTDLERVPGGAKVERKCGACGEVATFYEKKVTKTFRLYFIDVFDYERHRVMACGCCGASYATDELGRPLRSEDDRNLAGVASGYAERAGAAVSNGLEQLGGMLSGVRRPAGALSGGEAAGDSQSREEAPRQESRSAPRPEGRRGARPGSAHAMSDDELDREIAAIRGEEIDDSEARFRELEEKAKKGG